MYARTGIASLRVTISGALVLLFASVARPASPAARQALRSDSLRSGSLSSDSHSRQIVESHPAESHRAESHHEEGFLSALEKLRGWMDQGKYRDVEGGARALLVTTQADRGARSLEAGKVLDLLVQALRLQEKVREPEARALAELAVAIKEGALGPEHPEVAASLDNLGNLLRDVGDYGGARSILARALAIRETALGPGHPDVASSLNSMGILLFSVGDHRAARSCFERSLAIREEALGSEHIQVAESLNNLGSLVRRTGDYQGARRLLERSLKIRERNLGREHPDVARSLNDLAGLLYETGDYGGARPLWERSLAIRVETLGAEHVEVARNLSNLAQLLRETGDYGAARPLYERSLAIAEKTFGPKHLDVSSMLNNLAAALTDVRDYESARALYERSLAIREEALGPEHVTVGSSLASLGIIASLMGDHGRAQSLCQRALGIYEKSLGPDHSAVARVLHSLADDAEAAGEHEKAQSLCRRALGIHEKTLGPDHPRVAESLSKLADLSLSVGEYAHALSLYERSLTIQERSLGREHPDVVVGLTKLGTVFCLTGEPARAESVLCRAGEIFEVARLRAGTGVARATFRESPYPLLAATRLKRGMTEQAWSAAERALGRALADLLTVSGRRSLSSSEAAREASLGKRLSQLEGELSAGQLALRADTTGEAAKRFEETRTQLLAAEADWGAFQREMAVKYPLSEGRGFSLERVQQALPAETALIGWLWVEIGRQETACWGYVVRNSGPVNWARLGSLAQNAQDRSSFTRARDLRKALAVAAGWHETVLETSEVDSCARQVWQDWGAPLEPFLKGVRNLVVIPSGPMWGLPVETLVDSEGRHWGEEYAISYAPSASIYTWLQEQQAGRPARPPRKALLVGDPAFTAAHLAAMMQEEKAAGTTIASTRPSLGPGTLRAALAGNEGALAELPRLPWTREEVRRIRLSIPEAKILLGREASEQELLHLAESGQLRKFDALHLATHALVDDEAPDRSALILSRVGLPDPLQAILAGHRLFDGLVTAKEIAREWELDADLVALSGCQTGLGKEIAGEGYVGLAHAFLQAGARSVLVSLWRVEDEATCLLMGRFYENITGSYRGQRAGRSGQPIPKAEALREAKYWLRTYRDAQGEQRFGHPAYWSGFVLIGDPD